MSAPTFESLQKHYEQDPRIPCHYGTECYQKNPKHHGKYKHPPKKTEDVEKDAVTKKRKNSSSDEDSDKSPKVQKTDPSNLHDLSPSPEQIEPKPNEKRLFEEKEVGSSAKTGTLSDDKIEDLISDLFLVKMPADFYKFYELCKELSPKDPQNAFKAAHITLVGPFDVLLGKVKNCDDVDKEKFLRHWRYFYDPPEFQTILKGNDKDGLHFGYWRDDPAEDPVFVVKNQANVGCLIEPVAQNIFGAVNVYLEERLKLCNVFEKTNISRLIQKVKTFAETHNFKLGSSPQSRDKKVVAKTFHRLGIVVPYNKKTQLGYRELAASNVDLKKMLQRIDEAETPEKRTAAMSSLQEVVRYATIAADECDFGTCLELGHDLFSSGSAHVQNITKCMFSMAYTHLNRHPFLKIIEAHLQDRKKECDLSVI